MPTGKDGAHAISESRPCPVCARAAPPALECVPPRRQILESQERDCALMRGRALSARGLFDRRGSADPWISRDAPGFLESRRGARTRAARVGGARRGGNLSRERQRRPVIPGFFFSLSSGAHPRGPLLRRRMLVNTLARAHTHTQPRERGWKSLRP